MLPTHSTRWLGGLSISLLFVMAASAQPSDTTRVLFIGNSYVYFNHLPALVEGVAASKGNLVDADMHVRGGATLRRHLDEGVVESIIRTGQWDYVILQEQSTLGGRASATSVTLGDPAAFHAAARELHAIATDAGAQTVIMMTWARAFAPETQDALSDAYLTIAEEMGAEVAPVGWAWEAVRPGHPFLYHPDQSHPSASGSYLTAAVLYATLFGESPEGATGALQGHPVDQAGIVDSSRKVSLVALDAATAMRLQQTAWAAYQALADRRE